MVPRGNVRDTLLTFTTTGGWSDLGLASMIGMANPIGVIVGILQHASFSTAMRKANKLQVTTAQST